jgi:hypothetical protein
MQRSFFEILKGESFEKIFEKLIHAKFQLFNTFLTFFQENIRIFRKPLKREFRKILNLSMQFHT